MGQRLLAMLALGLVVACQGGPSSADAAKLHAQAQAALGRWADAVAAAGSRTRIVPVGELTGQVGDWEPAVGDNNKPALMAGLVASTGSLAAGAPADGQVRWQDGMTVAVPLMSAQRALVAIETTASGSCGDCTELVVTGAALVSGSIQTSRGPATAPIWAFSVKGTAVKLTRVAIADPVTVTPPPWDPNNPPIGLAIDSATGTTGGRDLTVTFVGAPDAGNQPCGEDYTAEAVESDLAVVVVVTRHPYQTLGACRLVGARRSASVSLAAPLGERAVLEVQQGLPVPVTLTP